MRIGEVFQEWERSDPQGLDVYNEQAEKERQWQREVRENKAHFAEDLSAGLRELYLLEQELGGKPGTLSEWARAAYEVNEDFEEPYTKVIGDICAALRDVDHQYGREIAQQLYNASAIILASEIRSAAHFLSLGGRFESLKGLADAGFFMEDYDHDTTVRAVQFINDGGDAGEVYRAISNGENRPTANAAPGCVSAETADGKRHTEQKEVISNPMLKLAAQIRESTCGICRVGPGPFGFGVCSEPISMIGIVIRITPDPQEQPNLVPDVKYTATVEAIINLPDSHREVIEAEELASLSIDADPATQIVAKAALELSNAPITLTEQEYSDAFDALAQLEQMGLDTGISEAEAKRLDELGWYKDKTPEEIVSFQLFEKRLCMPFDQFQAAVESALGRPVWTHEFASPKCLREEFLEKLRQDNPAQTMTL